MVALVMLFSISLGATTITTDVANGSTVQPGDRIQILASDSACISKIAYCWEFDPSGTYTEQAYLGTSVNCKLNLTVPSVTGTTRLAVKAINSNGVVSDFSYFTYNIGGSSSSTTADTTPPTISFSPKTGSEIAALGSVTYTVTDAGKLNTLTYSWNGGTAIPYDVNGKTSFSNSVKVGSAPGTYKLQLIATDMAGNEAIANATFIVEETVTEVDVTVPEVVFNPVNGSTLEIGDTVKVIVADAGILESVKYSWDGGSYTSFSGVSGQKSISMNTSAVKTAGTHTLKAVAVDKAGNSTTKSAQYIVNAAVEADTTVPTLSINPNGGTVAGGTVPSITAADAGKLASISYQWKSDTQATVITSGVAGKTSATINTNAIGSVAGNYTLTVIAKDQAGNSTSKTVTFTVAGSTTPVTETDTTKPTVTLNPVSGSTVDGGSTIKIIAADAGKLSSIQYSWDGGVVTSPSGVSGKTSATVETKISTTAGKHTLTVEVFDIAGNVTKITGTYTVKEVVEADTTKPTVSINPNGGTVAGGTVPSITAADAGKLASIAYKWASASSYTTVTSGVAGKTSATINTNAIGTAAGNYTLTVIAKDQAGNEATKTVTFTVAGSATPVTEEDVTKPVVVLNPVSGSTVEGGSSIKIVAADAGILASMKYKWGNNSYTTLSGVDGNKSVTKEVTITTTPGTYTLTVITTDRAGNSETTTGTYTVKATETPDTSVPTVSVNPNGGVVKGGTVPSITAKDNKALASIAYKWASESSYTTVTSGVAGKTSATINTNAIGTAAGNYTLTVIAKDQAGNSATTTVVFVVEGQVVEEDTTKPTVTVSPAAGVVKGGTVPSITAKDNEALASIAYKWASSSSYTTVTSGVNGNKTATINTNPIGTAAGTYTLTVVAKDQAGNSATKTVRYEVEPETCQHVYSPWQITTTQHWKICTKCGIILVEKAPHTFVNNVCSVCGYRRGDNPTEISADPKSGSTVEMGDRISLLAEDDDGISYIEYYWNDDDDDTMIRSNFKATTKVPSEEGKNYLYVRAMDDLGNLSSYKRFTYYVEDNEYPGNSDIDGDLNESIRAVRVEIGNVDDKICFEPNEYIEYYVYYYNGTNSKVSNAKLEAEFPKDFSVVKVYDNGTKGTRKVTWNLGTLDPKEFGKVRFTIKYTNKDVNELIFEPMAKIYAGSSLKDTSITRNMIYNEDADGTGSHTKYCVGYPDGTFRPEGTITRAELASMIARILEIDTDNYPYRGAYSDVSANFWAAGAIQACTDRGLVTAYTYNTFNPNQPATRAMLSFSIAKLLEVEDLAPVVYRASDTKNHPIGDAMEQLLRLNIIDGYKNGKVQPEGYITRAEAVTIINKYLFRGGLETNHFIGYNNNYYGYYGNTTIGYTHNTASNDYYSYNQLMTFTDLHTGHWAYAQIMEATSSHFYTRTTDGNEIITNR